jgi:calcineurin-like phosphoesterase
VTSKVRKLQNNSNFGQITGIQEKLDTTCKQNASQYITQGNETLLPHWQKESWQTFEEASEHVRPERVNKWPKSMTDI